MPKPRCTTVTRPSICRPPSLTPSSLDSVHLLMWMLFHRLGSVLFRNNKKEDVSSVLECSQYSWLNLWMWNPEMLKAGCALSSQLKSKLNRLQYENGSNPSPPPLFSLSLLSYQSAHAPCSPDTCSLPAIPELPCYPGVASLAVFILSQPLLRCVHLTKHPPCSAS